MQDKGEELKEARSSSNWWQKAKHAALNNCGMYDVGRDAYRVSLTYIGTNYGPVAGPSSELTNGAPRETDIPHDRPAMAPGNNDISKMQGPKNELDEVPGASSIQDQSGSTTEVSSSSSPELEATAAYVDADLRAINCMHWKTLDCEVAPIDAYNSRAEMYALSMLTHKAGYPLYMPEPQKGLEIAYRKTGVNIGDVGVVTPNGAFDFLFNACDYSRSTNPAKLPDDFEALKPEIVANIKFSHNVYLTSNHTNRIQDSPTVAFQCSAAEGAVLALPEGATVYEASNRFDFQKYAARHAVSLYKYMLDRGRDTPNGSLYVVTECVKSRNWGIAAFYGKSGPGDYLRFVPLEKPAKKSRYLRFIPFKMSRKCHSMQVPYGWDHFGKVEPRIGPTWTDIIADHNEPNQCIFLRGYKIKLQKDIWDKLRNSIDVPSQGGEPSQLRSAGAANTPTRNSNVRSQNATSGSGNQDVSSSSDKGYQRGQLTTQQMEVKSESTDHNAYTLADYNSLEFGQVTLKENAIIPPPAHPSDLINDMLLQRNPTAKVALAHDSEWCDTLPHEFFANPRKSKFGSLLENVHRSYTSIVDDHGCAVLVKVMPSATANAPTTTSSAGNASMHRASLTNPSQDTKRCLTNASQDVGKALAHISPSRFRDMAPVRIACRDWNDGEIFDWYTIQPHTTISKLELRKERDYFKNEYIVIYLDNGWFHRIERRPINKAIRETISEHGCEAEDSLMPISDKDLEVIRSETDAEITLEFPSNKPDLYNVIAIVVAIHLDPQTKNYTLQQYNCYFVARSIIALITRHCLLHAPLLTGLRWDRVTESAIFDYIFGGNLNKLAIVMKASISAVLDDLLWDIVKEDAMTRMVKKKDWDRLMHIVRKAVHEEVERNSATLEIHDVQRAVNKWIMDATQATLWHKSLDQSLSDRRYTKQYETTAEDAIKVALKPQLVMHLPGNMLKGLGDILPERLINRIPPATLIDLPPEVLARLPVRVLEKFPDDLMAKLPYDAFRNAPAELWQKLSVQVFSKARDAMVVTLPDDLSVVPQRLLEVSLQRMQFLLDQPKDHPDRVSALELLRRLPPEQLTRLDSSYVAMHDSEAIEELDTSAYHPMGEEQTVDELVPTKPQRLPLGRLKRKWDRASFIGLMIRFTPMPILKHVPPRIVNLIPKSSLRLIPVSALERLPEEFLARIPASCFQKLPIELLCKVPESLLQKMPRSTLERMPIPFLERLPTELVRKLPEELLDNIPEGVSDQIREAIQLSAFEGEGLRQQILLKAKEILGQALVTSSGELPPTVIQVSVRANLTERTNKKVLKHEDLQEHILNMIRVHSKMVAQVPFLGMGEERVYEGLYTKTEEIWQVMRLHPSMPGHS